MSVASQSTHYKIVMEMYEQHDCYVQFQPAVVNRKNFLFVSLLKLSQHKKALDKKILPIDVYSGCLALSYYDIAQFCKSLVMPCISVTFNPGQKPMLQVSGEKLEELQRLIQLKTESASSIEFERSRAM
jgi:hypothetical protein